MNSELIDEQAQAAVKEARKALICLHIAVENTVAADVHQKVERAFDALAKPVGWQPMETAPKDTTSIIINTNTGAVEAWYDPPRTVETANGAEIEGGMWICYDDKFQVDEGNGLKGWMPLPHVSSKAPEEKA